MWVGAVEGMLGKGCWQGRCAMTGAVDDFPCQPCPTFPQRGVSALCSKVLLRQTSDASMNFTVLLNVFSFRPGFCSLKIWLRCKFQLVVHQTSFVTSICFYKYSKPRAEPRVMGIMCSKQRHWNPAAQQHQGNSFLCCFCVTVCLSRIISEGFGSPSLHVVALDTAWGPVPGCKCKLRYFFSVEEVRHKTQTIYIKCVNVSVSFYK